MTRRVLAVLLFAVLCSSAVMAAEQKAAPEVVAQQPLTLTAQPEEKPLMMRMMSNGAVGIALDDQFDHRLVARVNEAGEIELTCTDDHELAQMLLANKPPVDTILRIRGGRAQQRRAERE
jgi:hypothetical protein